jgi:hypothetical protein
VPKHWWRRHGGERTISSPVLLKEERHDLPLSPVEDSVAHNQHPSAEPSRQRFLGHKGNHRYLASIELNRRRRERLSALVHDAALAARRE